MPHISVPCCPAAHGAAGTARDPQVRHELAASRVTGTGSTDPELDADLARRRMSEVMITTPKTLPIETPVDCVQAAFEDSHIHMVLLAYNGVLHGTLLRADLPTCPSPTAPALPLAALRGRTIRPDERIEAVHRWLVKSGQRRLAVVDAENRLLGLLCLKKDQTGFCTDQGVAARALDRSATGRRTP